MSAYELEAAAGRHGLAAREVTERPLAGNQRNQDEMERIAYAMLAVVGELRRYGAKDARRSWGYSTGPLCAAAERGPPPPRRITHCA